MPKLSGIEVLKFIKEDPKLKTIRVIMLTTSKQEGDLIESYKYGTNAYVVKPVEISQFMEAIKHIGEFWIVINEPPPKKN